MNKVKIIGTGLITLVITFAFIAISLVIFELILKNNDRNSSVKLPLYETEYYGHRFNKSPYAGLSIQYIHPYYMFSLPWQERDIAKANSSIVSIADDGFREIEIQPSKDKKLVFLGGSTAFGHFSSKNNTTIGAYLNQLSPLAVVNRNAPSWNSHQELVALLKYDFLDKVEASISLSLANDISIICNDSERNSYEALDFPENWAKLKKLVSNIRGEPKTKTFVRNVKDIALKTFPNTYLLLHKIKEEDSINKVASKSMFGNCDNHDIERVAKSFLSNQNKMSKLAQSYGFKHFLIIQPQFELHNGVLIEEGQSLEKKFKKSVIKYVMDSKYCSKNPCLDLSTVFDNKGFFLKKYYNSVASNDSMLKQWIESGIFVDNLHLNDRGNKVIAQETVKWIDFLQY